jgi:hypothetical protein
MRYILTNVDLDPKGLDEIEELLGKRPTVIETDEMIPPKWNPFHRSMWADFDWMRKDRFPEYATVCAFFTSLTRLRNIGITNHLGMYDVVDSSDTIYFYAGLPERLDRRAKANGFKTNLAWLFIHELLHGKEKARGGPDRTHTMEEQGRLKELLESHIVDIVEAPRNVPEVVITHHALANRTNTLADLDQWHKDRGFPKSRLGYHIGYHYVVRQGKVYQTRHHDEEGMHTLGMNRRSIGVCFMDNYDVRMPAQNDIDAWIQLYNKLREDYTSIPTGPHRAFQDNRSCHGTKITDDFFDIHHQKWGLKLQVVGLLTKWLNKLRT